MPVPQLAGFNNQGNGGMGVAGDFTLLYGHREGTRLYTRRNATCVGLLFPDRLTPQASSFTGCVLGGASKKYGWKVVFVLQAPLPSFY